MLVEELLTYAKDPTRIISPVVCDELLFWASSWLGDYEESLSEVDQKVSQRLLTLIDNHRSVAKAKVYLETEDIYLQQQTIERRIRELRSFRSNVKRRYEILTNRILNK